MQRYCRFILTIGVIFLLTAGCFEEVVETNGDLNGNDNGNGEPGDFSHILDPGESNSDFVTDRVFTELVVEVQFLTDAEPDEAALQELAAFLQQHLQKEEIIITTPRQVSSPNLDVYDIDDIVQIEENNREFYTDENQLAAYVLFTDGEFIEPDAPSVAYFNTSIALFGSTIDRISGPLQFEPSKASVEATLMKHQFGHLMGLVNNGTEMAEDHQDAPNGAHCTDEECLMNFRINSANFFESFFQDAEFELDSFCSADIQLLRES